ncbi:exopolysaccharide transport family protein [Pedobacter gandavensis]|uniref:exopolysaccharide transport family protein n=1 Tax=Pedobacter gandavensis TaxID=2679963 RepID=UPI00292CAF7E|nr:Wzz/FepE/Etk N-terminal domain-containing protein [Pedobacter gandavensis]
MDFKDFLKHLNRYKWLVIIVPVVTVVITYFMVKNMPKEYSSEVQISTGLVDQSKQVYTEAGQGRDYYQTSQQFANIMEKMKMKKIMSILSYSLILHDLENPKNPFKKYSSKLDSLSATQREEVIALVKNKLASKSVLTVADNNEKYPLYAIIESMGFDEKSIDKKLSISHTDGSDFITVKYLSANPELSAYVVNTLSKEFISNYALDVNFNQNNSMVMLDSLLRKKEEVMNQKNEALRNFKMANGVLNLDKQSEIVYSQISQNEELKAQAIRSIQSNQGAIAAIEAKLRGSDPYVGGNIVSDNRDIVNIKNQLKVANDRYIDGGFKVSDKRKIDSLSNILSNMTARNSDNNITDPTVSKQNLIQQRAALQIATDQAKSSIAAIDKELAMLRGKYNKMVPFDAGIQNYERDADLATKDYMEALNRYNQTRTEQNIGLKLNIAQYGLIGTPEPSKAIIYLALSGIGSFSLCFIAVIGLYFLDNSIYSPKQLEQVSGLRVIGNLTLVDVKGNSIKSIWNDTNNPEYIAYKNLLRSIRLEISNEMEADDSKILGITSLGESEGKSFLASSLAQAFAVTGKKILLIGGENHVPVASNTKELVTRENFETFLVKKEIRSDDLITVLNKNNENTSLLELQSNKSLKAGFEALKGEFDLIIVDINSMRDLNVAKEWLMFMEKSLIVFEVGGVISDTDRDALNYLKEQPGLIGWVLNKIRTNSKN